MEIRFISGKGGVGKSSIAAAMALNEAKKGRKTLLAELGHQSFFESAFQKSIKNTPVPWKQGVDVVLWDGTSCLREYALHLLKSETLYRLFFENSVSRTLIQIAPGLSELAILGKVTSGPPRNIGPALNYEVIIVDAFASGHFLALLDAPVGLSNAVQIGPMAEQTKSIIGVLKDKAITQFHLVTLPEELPIQETLETSQKLQEKGWGAPKIWINRCLPDLVESEPNPEFKKFVEGHLERQKLATKQFPGAQKLPWVLSNHFESSVDQIAEVLR